MASKRTGWDQAHRQRGWLNTLTLTPKLLMFFNFISLKNIMSLFKKIWVLYPMHCRKQHQKIHAGAQSVPNSTQETHLSITSEMSTENHTLTSFFSATYRRMRPRTSAAAAYTSLYFTKDILLTKAWKYLQQIQRTCKLTHYAVWPNNRINWEQNSVRHDAYHSCEYTYK